MAVVLATTAKNIISFANVIAAATHVTGAVKSLWASLTSWFKSAPVQQCSLVQGTPNIGDHMYQEQINRHGANKYTTTYKDRGGRLISGVAVVPISAKLTSPNARVVSGGVGESSVTIELEAPANGGDWGCVLTVCGERTAQDDLPEN